MFKRLFSVVLLLTGVTIAASPSHAVAYAYSTYSCSYWGPDGNLVNTTVSAKADNVAILTCKNLCTSAWASAPQSTPTDNCTDTPQFGTICSGSSTMSDCDTARVVQQ